MTRWRWIIAAAVVVGLLAFVAMTPMQEIWLGVPEDLRGAIVYADQRQVAVVDQPALTLIRLWRPAKEVRLEKPGFEAIALAPKSRGKSYLVVEKTHVKRTVVSTGIVRQTP